MVMPGQKVCPGQNGPRCCRRILSPTTYCGGPRGCSSTHADKWGSPWGSSPVPCSLPALLGVQAQCKQGRATAALHPAQRS